MITKMKNFSRKYIYYIIPLSIISILLVYFNTRDAKLIQSDVPKIRMISGKKIISDAYIIPYSVFNSVGYPFGEYQYFFIGVTHYGFLNSSIIEKDYKIDVPIHLRQLKEVDMEWRKEVVKYDNKNILYSISNKDNSISFELELPVKKRKYTITILHEQTGFNMVLFMDIEDEISDKGLFGYIILEK